MKNTCKIFKSKMFTLVCCNFSKSQGGKIQTLLELSYHSHLKKEGMTAAIGDAVVAVSPNSVRFRLKKVFV